MPNTAMPEFARLGSSVSEDRVLAKEPVISCALEFLNYLHPGVKSSASVVTKPTAQGTSPWVRNIQAATLFRSPPKTSVMQLLYCLSMTELFEQLVQGSCQDSLCLTELRDYMDKLSPSIETQM